MMNPFAPVNSWNAGLDAEGAALREAMRRGVFRSDLLALWDANAIAEMQAPFAFDGSIAGNSSSGFVLDFFFPRGFDGVITGLTTGYIGAVGSQVDGDGQLTWTFLVDGRAVPNYGGMVQQFGTIQEPRRLLRGVPVFSGQEVSVFLTIARVGFTQTGCRFIAAVSGVRFPTSRR